MLSVERSAIEAGYMSADSATKSDKLVMGVFLCPTGWLVSGPDKFILCREDRFVDSCCNNVAPLWVWLRTTALESRLFGAQHSETMAAKAVASLER